MSIPIFDRAMLDPNRLNAVRRMADQHSTLEKLIASGVVPLDIRAADEFSLDAIVRAEESVYLVYHMT